MKISQAEQEAIQKVIELGAQYGYGNLIMHMQTAWARSLIDGHGMEPSSARLATARDGSGYPFQMQEDLLLRGEWDETGERYRPKSEDANG